MKQYLAILFFYVLYSSTGLSGMLKEDADNIARYTLIRAFCEDVSKGDFTKALSLTDTDIISECLDFPYLTGRMTSIQPVALGPADHAGFIDLNKIQEKAKLGRKLRHLVYSLLLPSEYSQILDLKAYGIKGDSIEEFEEAGKNFSSYLDPKRLTGFELIRLDVAAPNHQLSPRGLESKKKHMQTYRGCQDILDCTVLYKWNEKFYVGGVVFRKFDGKWYIGDLSSTYGNTSALGNLKRLDKIHDTSLYMYPDK